MAAFTLKRLLIQALVLLQIGVNGAAIEPRAVINHDSVVGFAEAVPNTAEGASFLKFKPWLKVVNGCVPFPAVDAAGNTGGGLATTGGSNSGCSKSIGQVYARGAWYNGRYALMYSWYMPKDSPSPGLGHRHDWEAVVVWINNPAATIQTILAVSPSAHGSFDTTVNPGSDIIAGTRAKIQYYSIFPVNHQLGTTTTQGGEQPLIAWDSLTEAARVALTNTDFGSANVPFKDSNFQSNLQKASF